MFCDACIKECSAIKNRIDIRLKEDDEINNYIAVFCDDCAKNPREKLKRMIPFFTYKNIISVKVTKDSRDWIDTNAFFSGA